MNETSSVMRSNFSSKSSGVRCLAFTPSRSSTRGLLRNNPRVELREGVNARHLTPDDFDEKFDLITLDVSFISATKILPAISPLLKDQGRIITLIKPQFEVGKGEVGKGG